MAQDPPSLSLLGKSDLNTSILAVQITDSLVQYDARLELQPRVAESFELSDDGLELTFRLRSGVRWHDGAPVVAADVVHSAQLARDPAVESRTWAAELEPVVSVEALDARTVRVRYAHPIVEYLEPWRLPLVPAHLAGPAGELLTGPFAAHPVGCGPFRFVRYLPGREILLEANPDYWDGPPAIGGLLFLISPDQRTGLQALLAGDVDVMVVTTDAWDEASRSPGFSRLAQVINHRLGVWQIFWNQDGSNPFFGDPRVRRAMILACDREQFIESVVHGMARPAATSYHPDLIWADPDVRPLPYDPEQAGWLLDQAGWIDRDGDGVRERDGRPFEFTLLTHVATQALADQIAAWLQQAWSRIGVRARIERLELVTYRQRRDGHRFEAAMSGVSFTPSPDHYPMYHTSAVAAGFNFGAFSDPEVDRLLEQGRVARDRDARREIYFRLQRRLAELQPNGWLLHLASPVLYDRRLIGLTPTPIDHWQTSAGPRLWRWSEDPGRG